MRKSNTLVTGFCGICFRPLMADQPGGINPRHVEDESPYGSCRLKRD